MNKATLSPIVLLLCTTFSINSMNFDLDLYSQPLVDHHKTSEYTIQLAGLTAAFSVMAVAIPPLLKLAYNKLNTNNNQPLPDTNLLWIETSDNKTFLMDIKKDLPPCGLQFLLKRYSRRFGRHNSKEAPLKTACSLEDYQLLGTALNAIDNDMLSWNFTEQEQILLLEITSSFKILNLYLALIDPTIQTSTITLTHDINKNITPLLFTLNKEIHSIASTITMVATQSIKHTHDIQQPVNDRKYTSDKKYYAQESTIYDAETNQCVIKTPKHTTWTLLPQKNFILFSSITMNRLFIYDINNKKTYHLPITSLKGCRKLHVSPDENYIATHSGMNTKGKYNPSLIHLWNISDIDTLTYYKPLYHRAVSMIIFSPESTHLISGADNNSVELWNLAELSDEDIISKPILCNDKINTMTFNKDNKTLAIKHSPDDFCHIISLIHIETLDSHTIVPTKQYPSSIFSNDSDFIMYSTYDDERKEFAFKIMTKDGIELYSKKIDANIEDSPITSVISNNNRHIAINCLRNNNCDFLTIDHPSRVKTKTIIGHCDYINDDGSFYTHRQDTIYLHNTVTNDCTTLYYNPQKHISSVNIMPDKTLIKYTYYSDYKSKGKAYRHLLDETTHTNINNATRAVTPLQYLLIKQACNKPKNHNALIPIKQNSLKHHTLQSFGKHEELITKTLKLQITDT